MKNRFPIYVISKGRWQRRQTVKTLLRANVNFKVVVEPSEYNNYNSVIDSKYLIKLDKNLSELNQGSVPVRNWVWEHSISQGFTHHWILDDNIEGIYRFNKNRQIICNTSTPFYCCEEFILRYENISISGMNYHSHCPKYDARPAFRENKRIYSNLLIKNSIPYRWRGKYNEDTDLCLRVLKGGECTVLFNAFLIGKRCTMAQGGGNEKIYKESDNRRIFAESLRDQHPDIVKVVWRFNRWHHQVDYSVFKQKLKRKPNIELKNKINNYKMKLRRD